MTLSQLTEYLEGPDDRTAGHLEHELKWLLRAASEWHLQDKIQLGLPGVSVQVYAMDSAFLHARTLFEFFTMNTGDNYYGISAYGLEPIPSHPYTDGWKDKLHAFVMHAQDRSRPGKLKCVDGTEKDLNKMPVDFAKEIVRVWREFQKGLTVHQDPFLRELAPIAERILHEAIEGADAVMTQKIAIAHKVEAVSWTS